MNTRRRRLRGTWTRAGEYEDDTIRLYESPGGWELHRTGHTPRVGLTEAAALLAVHRITGDAWIHTPPPCRCQLARQATADVVYR